MNSNRQPSSCCGGSFRGNNNKRSYPSASRHHGRDPYHDVDETLLARELNELTVEEREHLYEDVHGVAKLQEETEEFVEASIKELRDEIAKLSRGKRRALDRAFFLRPTLRNDRGFFIMFLRADRYNAQNAANRMALYFTSKLELFGEHLLVQEITLEDLDEDDMECVNTGSVQFLREKDRSGRAVIFVAHQHCKYKHWKNHTRYCWYQVMSALEDEETQIRGMVDVVYFVGVPQVESTFPALMTEGVRILNNLPFRVAAIHFCYDSINLTPAMSLLQLIMAKQSRLRFRAQFGSNVEVQYALMSFGIPTGTIPIHPDGRMVDELNQQYLQERRLVEAERKKRSSGTCSSGDDDPHDGGSSSSNKFIEYPTLKDVLLGRGKPFQQFSGNQQMTKFVDDMRRLYHSKEDRFEKTLLTIEVVKKVTESGGRFLQRTMNGWEEVDDSIAREKVSHAFRTKATSKHIMDDSMKATTTTTETTAMISAEEVQSKRLRFDEKLAKWGY